MSDPRFLDEFLLAMGYSHLRMLPSTNERAGVMRMAFTTALFVGLDETGYRTRYCYENRMDAVRALETWDGAGDPPGPWIKQKPQERLGPGAML